MVLPTGALGKGTEQFWAACQICVRNAFDLQTRLKENSRTNLYIKRLYKKLLKGL